jgi:hypothetical protein
MALILPESSAQRCRFQSFQWIGRAVEKFLIMSLVRPAPAVVKLPRTSMLEETPQD